MLSDVQKEMLDLNRHPHHDGKGLGRLLVPDQRDEEYSMAPIMANVRPQLSEKYWDTSGWHGDQGSTSMCVAFSWTHWLDAGPVYQKHLATKYQDGRPMDPVWLYGEAQKIDAWPGEDYEGTSVRAGAKILQQEGMIKSYRWAWDLNTMIKSVLTFGPMVVGTWWYWDMYYADKKGLIKVGGRRDGGHAYLISGVDVKKELFQIKNSWGPSWGINGYGYISFNDMERLIKEDGECCIAFEEEILPPTS